MTYLEIVNQVLRRIREDEVASLTQNTYAKMVADFVNDAYSFVSNAWDWSGLRQEIVITTVDGTGEYALTGADAGCKVLTVSNGSTKQWLEYKSYAEIEGYYNRGPVKGSPTHYTFTTTTDGVPNVKLFPEPDQEYTITFTAIVRDVSLVNFSDKLRVPHQPVVHMTVAMLARERGETSGTSTAEYFIIADKYLGDAIALDANRNPENLVWRYI